MTTAELEARVEKLVQRLVLAGVWLVPHVYSAVKLLLTDYTKEVMAEVVDTLKEKGEGGK